MCISMYGNKIHCYIESLLMMHGGVVYRACFLVLNIFLILNLTSGGFFPILAVRKNDNCLCHTAKEEP